MVLIDLGGTIFFRTDDKSSFTRRDDFKLKKNFYFLRPGHEDFIRKIAEHPRVLLCFYTSIMRKNVVPILYKVLDENTLLGYDLSDLRDKVGIFDQSHCSVMVEHKYYKELAEDKWNTYRDVEKVFSSDYCQEHGLDASNSLLIDSDSRKVQLCLENSLVNTGYMLADVNREARVVRGQSMVLDDNFHRNNLKELQEYVFELLHNADNVQDYLRENPSEKFTPEQLF
jgi:hypothetical protein